MNAEELTAAVSGRYYASLPEIKEAFLSRGYNVTMSEAESSLLLPAIKSSDIEISEVKEGYYLILKSTKGNRVYRFVAYKTSKGYYLQEDIGTKNPYQT